MAENKSLKQLYREQYELEPKLDEDEITELYLSEGITELSVGDMVAQLQQEIDNRFAEYDDIHKKVQSDFQQACEYQDKLQEEIEALKQQENKLKELADELSILLGTGDKTSGILTQIKTIEDEIEKKEREIEESKQQEADSSKKNLNKKPKLMDEIDVLIRRLRELKEVHRDITHDFYMCARGIKPKDRKYPSVELRNKVVCGNLGLAKYYATVYYYKCEKSVPLDDLIEIAYEALMSAAYYFVPSPVAKFKTYARVCIENKLKRTIGQSKKRTRKRPTKPLDFIDEELRRMEYVRFFLEAMKKKSKSGKLYYSSKYKNSTSLTLYRFREAVRDFNFERRVLGEPEKQLPSFRGRRSDARLAKVKKNVQRYLTESKLPVLITDDEFEMASLFTQYQNRPQELVELYEFIYVFELYISRLKTIRTFLEVEVQLSKENDGIVPTDKELLEEINRRIRKDNAEFRKLKKAGNVHPNKLYSYYYAYLDVWDVNFLTQDGSTSRKAEKKEILESFEPEKETFVHFCNYVLRMIKDNEEFFIEDVIDEFFDDDFSSFFTEILEGLSKITDRSEIQKFLNNALDRIHDLSDDEYLKKVLEKRKKVVLGIMKKKNAEIVRKNNENRKYIEWISSGGRYLKLWSLGDVSNAKNWSSLLFESGLYSYGDEERRKRRTAISLEDEVIGNLFMRDYYEELEKLPPMQREILLRYYDELGIHSMSAKEIGEDLGLTPKQVYKEKEKALRFLRKSSTLKGYVEE